MDKIYLIGLECFGRHGCSNEEQILGQRFLVDLELEIDLSKVNDEISNTIDYVDVAELTKSIVNGPKRKLIETVAVEIADLILEKFSKVKSVKVILHKPHSPIDFPIRDVAVEIYRER